MTQPLPPTPKPVLSTDFVAAHQTVIADKAIQFHLTQVPKYELPEWIKWFKSIGKALEFMAPAAKYIFWLLITGVLLTILYYVLREFTDMRLPWRRKTSTDMPETWAPDVAPARQLLADADALAAEGKYEEAAHLLLLRSVEDIESQRPNMLKPSSTSREIAVAASLPEKARDTFALIARHVEASLFGGKALDHSGWQQCRDAYGRFALAGESL